MTLLLAVIAWFQYTEQVKQTGLLKPRVTVDGVSIHKYKKFLVYEIQGIASRGGDIQGCQIRVCFKGGGRMSYYYNDIGFLVSDKPAKSTELKIPSNIVIADLPVSVWEYLNLNGIWIQVVYSDYATDEQITRDYVFKKWTFSEHKEDEPKE
jgi:hypothetical protein